MPLWSFPGIVQAVAAPYVSARLDLGCRLYADTHIKIAGIAGKGNTDLLADLLPYGSPFLAVCDGLSGGTDRAHLTLPDGRDVASALRGTTTPRTRQPAYGGGLSKQWTYPATVVSVTDGDTFRAEITTGSPVRFALPVRVAHCNAPEKDTAEGQAAHVWAERILIAGLQVTLTSHSLDKYGRLLASVTLPNSSDYAGQLIAAGHAVPYEGGPR